MNQLSAPAERFTRAVTALRSRGEASHDEAAAESSSPGRAGFYGARRAHLRRLAKMVGESTLEDSCVELARAGATPGVHSMRHSGSVRRPDLPCSDEAARAVLGALELVSGVGPVTARRLRESGVENVEELLDVDPFKQDAARVVADWRSGNLRSTCDRLTRRLGGRGHLLSALICSTVAIEDVAFLDLETMGLWNNTVFLAGVGRISGGTLQIDQYLAPSHADEPAVVASALAQLADSRIVVTFNGRSADVPWLAARAFYYGLGPVPALAHVDLLYGTRRRYQRDEERLETVRLPVVSGELLHLTRPCNDVPSWLVPEVYDHYTRAPSKREGMLVPILEHNRADLEALVHLLELLAQEAVIAQPSGAAVAGR